MRLTFFKAAHAMKHVQMCFNANRYVSHLKRAAGIAPREHALRPGMIFEHGV